MKFTKSKRNYQKRLEIAFILSLLVVILFFFVTSHRRNNVPQLTPIPILHIEVVQIPQTIQNAPKRLVKPLRPVIPVPSDEPDLLEEVDVDNLVLTVRPSSGQGGKQGNLVPPRQILESVPQKPDKPVNGQIVLSVHIGENGKFLSYKIIQNTTNCYECLMYILKALKKSKWLPARLNGKPIDYWLEKTYTFTINKS